MMYPKLLDGLRKCQPPERRQHFRYLCRTDLFFLLVYALKRRDADRQWLFDRCREVQASPDGHIDLWAREHYKSTIITFALTIQNILVDPELTVGIFSHTRPIAKGFLRQIMRELESNALLQENFDDILWANPRKEAPKWSEDDGIVVRRASNPKESTVEAWGIVDGQPTSKHFGLLVYDDVVTKESVTSPEMIRKVTESWEVSTNLGSRGGRVRFIGTRYHFNDTYREIMARGAAEPRIHAATADGEVDGEPVLLTREELAKKRRDQGPYTFACQMLQNPRADTAQGFRDEWLRYSAPDVGAGGMNTYLLVDPASAKKKDSDYTAAWVIGLSSDKNYYVLDMVRDRLRLTERADMVFALHRRWKPFGVGYERYGMMADIEHIKDRMDRENYHFSITELAGQMPKPDRIKRLIPVFEQGRMWMLPSCYKSDYEGRQRELVEAFLSEEYRAFPVGAHDDMLDSLSRILDEDLMTSWPMPIEEPAIDRYARRERMRSGQRSPWAA
jgi:predicted phage terminase large subunit-like protein